MQGDRRQADLASVLEVELDDSEDSFFGALSPEDEEPDDDFFDPDRLSVL